MSGERLDPSWLVGAVPRGILCTWRDIEIALEVSAPFDALVQVVGCLEHEADPDRIADLADTSPEEAARALETLRELGALTEAAGRPAPTDGVPLVEAILGVADGDPVELTWTATEALRLPVGTDPAVARRAVRWFVAGLVPDARAESYCAAATHRIRSVVGDVPDPEALADAAQRAREADPDQVHVVSLVDQGLASLPIDEVGRIGVERVHRLGPLQWIGSVEPGPPLGGWGSSFAAEYAIGNLAQPGPRLTRVGRGTSISAEAAETMSRAEAAERFAATDVSPARLRRAAAAELHSVLTPDRLCRFSDRQYETSHDVVPWQPGLHLLWIEGEVPGGDPCWVPAEAVHLGLGDPEAPSVVPLTSSGLAAGGSPDDAANRAVLELIERDAFMWTWLQRVSRERIDPAGLSGDASDLAGAVARSGFEVVLVNLTLETKPVVMAVLRREDRIHVAAACRDDASAAARKALEEASLAASLEAGREPPGLQPEEVRYPEEHMRLYMTPEWVTRAAFLTQSTDTIALEEVEGAAEPALEAVRVVGRPVLIDLTTPRTAPFHVTRALVPGLVPISFGWDREPLGVKRLAEPKTTRDGRRLGEALDLQAVLPILPHPFP